MGRGERSVWWVEKGRGVEEEMEARARVRAVVLFIVRRWWGRRSAFSEEARESMSERGMSSSSSGSSPSSSSSNRLGVGSEVDCAPLEVGIGAEASSMISSSLSLSLSSILEVSIYAWLAARAV